MISPKNKRKNRSEKRNIFKCGLAIFAVLTMTLISCGPQHHYAFEQFSANNEGEILSMQGYILDDSKVKTLQKDWDLLIQEMSKKPGFVSGYLSEGVGGSKLILAHSRWKDLESLRNAFADKKILELEAKLPKMQFEHLFNVGTLVNMPSSSN